MEASPKDVQENADQNTCLEMEIDTNNHSCNHGQSTCMIPAATNEDDTSEAQLLDDRIFKILIIGASGSGKSTAGNILLGKEHFPVSSIANPLNSETVKAMIGESYRKDRHLRVLDTPDICSVDVNNEDKARRELERWLNMCPDPHLILFTIRYSPADLQDAVSRFSRFKSLWDEDFIRQRLVVLFTFGNEGAPSKEELHNTRHAGLQEILDYAGHRYVIFDLTLGVSEQQERVDKVLCYLDELKLAQKKKKQNLTVMIIGKTGNGKSAVGNSILNKSVFNATSGMASSCRKEEIRSDCRRGKTITVIETPDVSNLTLEDKTADDEIKMWSEFDTDLILLAIRCDVRYTKEEHQIYQQIKRVLGKQYVCSRLAVAFTFGDKLDTDIKDELKSVYPELQRVLDDARHQYVVFSIDDQEEHKEKHFSKILEFVSKKEKPKKCAKNPLSESTPELSQVDCHHIPKDNTPQAIKREIFLIPDEPRQNINVLIVGKTGNGKSTVGNSLLNQSAFAVTRGLASSTTRPETKSAQRYGVNITVTDTPDLSNMYDDDKDVDKEIQTWRTFKPDVILLTIRCDVRYTPEEFQIYKQIKTCFKDDYLCPRLTVAFTFGERLDRDLKEELKDVCIELKKVLQDSDNRYLVFREEDDEENKRKHIMHLMTFVPNLAITGGEIKKILLLGPPKSGKSSLGDAIVGRRVFQAGTETVRTVSYVTEIEDTWCQVFDTPGISSAVEEQLRSLPQVTCTGPDAIFYFVKESIATTEELKLFRRFKGIIDENLWQHVLLVATMDVEEAPSVSEDKQVKDTKYISCQMSEEVKRGQTIWLIKTLTFEQTKDIFAQHVKRFFKPT